MEIKRIILGLGLSALFIVSIGLIKINLTIMFVTIPLLLYYPYLILKAKKNKWLNLYLALQTLGALTFIKIELKNYFNLGIYDDHIIVTQIALVYLILLGSSISLTFLNLIIDDKGTNKNTKVI